MILLSEHTDLSLIIIKYIIICINNKDYMSVGIGMCIFLSNVSDIFKLYLLIIFYIHNNQANNGNSWLCELCQLTF